MTCSYCLCSSVFLGARTPRAPAISRPATAVCFSGLKFGLAGLEELSLLLDREYGDSKSPHPPRAEEEVGEIGVGGGASGKSLA